LYLRSLIKKGRSDNASYFSREDKIILQLITPLNSTEIDGKFMPFELDHMLC
jgi:hypothetical protein